jgi:hypothetical protein
MKKVFFFILLVAASLHAQQTEADVMSLATKLIRVTRDWGETMSTPGLTAEMREVKRTSEGGRLLVQYHLYIKGVLKPQSYTAVSWPINAKGPQEVISGITLAPDGLAICAGRQPDQCGNGEKKDDPIEFTFLPAKAEPYRIALISQDQKSKIFVRVIPDPIMKTSGRCTIEAIRLLPKFEIGMLSGKGFKPNEDLSFSSSSSGESHDSKAKADANGDYLMALLPFVAGKNKGKTDIRLSSPSCSPALSFDWGSD